MANLIGQKLGATSGDENPMTYRLETGVLKPRGGWPGIFIRGDEAMGYAVRLRSLIAALEARAEAGDISEDEALACMRLQGLADLLESCWVPNAAGKPA